jgi:transcriptional regulator with XRE-family HTH domain
MMQPELGRKISELRNQKGFTQKDLSDSCGIDIRTIQRIEAGDVTPRPSTLKLITSALDFGFNESGFAKPTIIQYSEGSLIFYVFVGVFYLISWIIYAPLFPKSGFLIQSGLYVSILFSLISLIFYFGFFDFGRKSQNVILKISSLIILICIPISLIFTLIYDQFEFARLLQQVIIVLMGINSVAFGIGLLKIKREKDLIKNISGILQLLIAPFFILPVSILNYVGCWLTIPFVLVLISLIVQTYTETKKDALSEN